MKYMLRYKNRFMYLLVLLVSGIVAGALFSGFLNPDLFKDLSPYLNLYQYHSDSYTYFMMQLSISLCYLILILLIGTSPIGIALVSFLLYTKGIQIGLSIYLFLYTYHLKGIVGIVTILLPQVILDMLATFAMSACAIAISLRVLRCCLDHESLHIKAWLNTTLNECLFCIFMIVIKAYLQSTLFLKLMEIFHLW